MLTYYRALQRTRVVVKLVESTFTNRFLVCIQHHGKDSLIICIGNTSFWILNGNYRELSFRFTYTIREAVDCTIILGLTLHSDT